MTKRKKLYILIAVFLLILSGAFSYFDGIALIKEHIGLMSYDKEFISKLGENRPWKVTATFKSTHHDEKYITTEGAVLKFTYPNNTFIEVKAKNARYSRNQKVLFMPETFEVNINNQFKITSKKADLFIQQQLLSGREEAQFTAKNLKLTGVGIDTRLMKSTYQFKDRVVAELTTADGDKVTIKSTKASIQSIGKNIIFQHAVQTNISSKLLDGKSESLTAMLTPDLLLSSLDFNIGARVRVKKLVSETEKAFIDFTSKRLTVVGPAKVKLSKKTYDVTSLTYDYTKKKIKLKKKRASKRKSRKKSKRKGK